MQKRLEIGQIVNTFGIKGEVKVTPFTDDIRRFDDLKKVYVKTKKESKQYKVENARYHKNMVLLKFENINNPEDAEKLKEALRTLFINDASSARPDGSMEVVSVYWWRHNNKIGQYSAAKVHDSLKINLKEGVLLPSSVEDYEVKLQNLPELEPEIFEGI